MRLMIVDDSEPMRRYIRRIADLSDLEIEGYVEAENGKEALDLLERETVDIVLTDVNMPVMSGQEFMVQLSQHPELSKVPVVVVSTDRTTERIRSMACMGALGYIEKPFSPERLATELRRVAGVVAEAEKL